MGHARCSSGTRTAAAGPFARLFPHIPLFTVSQLFGDWQKAQKTYFADGGVFDQIYVAHR